MKTELQQKLLTKYPEFFQKELPIYSGDSTKEILENTEKLLNQKEMVIPIQFGFECGDGWYMLLDELMSEIQNYLKYKNESLDRAFKHKILWDFQRWLRFNSGKQHSWKNTLAEWIYKKALKGKPNVSVQIDQVKEKFGGLRFYYSGGDKEIAGMVRLAESLSYKICETCGSTQHVGQTRGWIYTICQSCLKNTKGAKDLIWVENN